MTSWEARDPGGQFDVDSMLFLLTIVVENDVTCFRRHANLAVHCTAALRSSIATR